MFAYLEEKNIVVNTETITKEDLNKILEIFFIKARKKNGEHYKKSGLQSLRAGIYRHNI